MTVTASVQPSHIVAQVMGSQAEALPDSAFPDIPDHPGTLSQPIEFDLNEQPDGCASFCSRSETVFYCCCTETTFFYSPEL